jgi:hypothetical protein
MLAAGRAGYLIGTAAAALLLVQPACAATRPPDEPAKAGPQLTISQAAPKGFENIDNTVETEFDVVFAGRRLGATRARVANGTITFLNPDQLLQLLPPQVDRAKVGALIAQPLKDNEDRRCPPGQTVGCGTLTPDQAGVIVSPETFTVTLFLTPDYILTTAPEAVYLGPPVSGPSLIQTALVSVSAGDRYGGNARFGGTFNTMASVGRSSLIGQVLVGDQGANLQRAYLQHYWDNRQAEAGVLQESNSLSFTTYRLVGAEFGSFFGNRLDAAEGPATPLQIVLPRAAVVEVYRDGVLIQTTRLDAGIQQIDTSNFPAGSYPVRIVARDGGQVLINEVQQFTRIGDLPPPGQWGFDLRAGVRVRDFEALDIVDGVETFERDRQPFLPSFANQAVIAASVTRRVGAATGVGLSGLLVGDHVYGELSGTTYHHNLRAVAAVAAGTDKSYSIIANTSLQLAHFDLAVSVRHTRVHGQDLLFLSDPDVFRPFFRSEDTIVGSLSFPLLKGSLTLNGSYSRTPTFDDHYAYGARYMRTFDMGRFGMAQLAVYGLKATRDVQVGVTLSFFKRVGTHSLLNYGGGAEYRKRDDEGPGAPDGVYPVASATLTRNDRVGPVDLTDSVGASTDADRDRVFASTDATSALGHFDGVVDYQHVRGDSSGFGFTGNLFSGIVIGGGHVKLGVRDEQGDAVALVGVSRDQEDRDLIGKAGGRYRILLGNQFVGTVAPGDVTALSLPSFRAYSIGLQPENSPPYAIDLTPKRIPLYPGNVALVDFHASRVVTLFGRLLDGKGLPLTGTRVSGAADTTFTDDHGYFVITAQPRDQIDFYGSHGEVCRSATPTQLIQPNDSGHDDYHPIGDVGCDADPAAPTPTGGKVDGKPISMMSDRDILARGRESLSRARALLRGSEDRS